MDGIPVETMNTSMTINATAAWLLGLYIAHAEDTGVAPSSLSGTTQNDIVKEYLSRGTYIFPPGPSRRLIVDMIAYTVRHVAQMEPDQRLQLPPPGSGGHTDPGTGLRAGHRHRRASTPCAIGQDRGLGAPGRGRSHLVLRERRDPLRGGDLQGAGLHRHVGPDLP
jgi:hypothetical protein